MKKVISLLMIMILSMSCFSIAFADSGDNGRTIYKVVDGKLVEISEFEFAMRNENHSSRGLGLKSETGFKDRITAKSLREFDTYKYAETSYTTHSEFVKYVVPPTYNKSSIEQNRSVGVSASKSSSFSISLSKDILEAVNAELGYSIEKSISVSDTISVNIPSKEWGYAYAVADIRNSKGKFTTYKYGVSSMGTTKSASGKFVTDIYIVIDSSSSKPTYRSGQKL